MDFKKGDRVRCKPGYTKRITNGMSATLDMSYGGYGYEEGRVFIIEFMFNEDKRIPVFGIWANGEFMDGGVFIDAIEHSSLQYYNIRKFSFV